MCTLFTCVFFTFPLCLFANIMKNLGDDFQLNYLASLSLSDMGCSSCDIHQGDM